MNNHTSSYSKGISLLLHNRPLFFDSIIKRYFKWLPDRMYLSIRYRCNMGHWINWNNPKAFSEKLQWLKLNNYKPEHTVMVDKFAVKEYVAGLIGEEHIIPTLYVWNNPDEINWDLLPMRFVLKTTHGGGGGGIVICKDKSSFNRELAVGKLKESLSNDIYSSLREAPYKAVPRRIIAENYLEDDSGELKDYKFFCFNGNVKFFKIDFGRFIEHHANYYSTDGVLLDYGEVGLEPDPNYSLHIPENLPEMITIAEKIAIGHPFIRVDLYNVKGKIYFGEMTFFPGSGLIPWVPSTADLEIGSFLRL